jgi:hypothetical protein
MVKQKSSSNLDRNMNAYKMRTPYGSSINHSQQNPSKYNHVEVAHSNGCCSSKKTHHIPSQPVVIQQQQQTQTPRQTAHDRSHLRLDSPDPFYHQHGRIKKNPNRTKKPHQQQHGRNQIHSTATTTTTNQRQTHQNYQSVQQTNQNYQPVQQTIPKKNSCCTIL